MAILRLSPVREVAEDVVKSAYQLKVERLARMTPRERVIDKTLESYRQQIRSIYPNAVFDTEFVLGISIPEYLAYLEERMQPGMTWEDKKGKWRVAAIRKMNEFDLTTGEGFYGFFHYTNRRPEWTKPKGFVANPDKPSPLDRDADQV